MNPLLTTVATEVAQEFGSCLSAILTPSNRRGTAEDARSRAIAMEVYRRCHPGTRLNLTELGKAFDRDRTTVRSALENVEHMSHERGFHRRLAQVTKRVRSRM